MRLPVSFLAAFLKVDLIRSVMNPYVPMSKFFQKSNPVKSSAIASENPRTITVGSC